MAAPLRISLAVKTDGAGDAQQQEAAGGGKQQQQTVSVRVCGDMVAGCAVRSMQICTLHETTPAPGWAGRAHSAFAHPAGTHSSGPAQLQGFGKLKDTCAGSPCRPCQHRRPASRPPTLQSPQGAAPTFPQPPPRTRCPPGSLKRSARPAAWCDSGRAPARRSTRGGATARSRGTQSRRRPSVRRVTT
jgi:hypothetical protein